MSIVGGGIGAPAKSRQPTSPRLGHTQPSNPSKLSSVTIPDRVVTIPESAVTFPDRPVTIVRNTQYASNRSDDAISVGLCGGLRINLQRRKQRYGRYWRDVIADGDSEDLADIGRRVGTDQQDTLAGFGQSNSGGAGDGGLAYAPLTSEEQKPWWRV